MKWDAFIRLAESPDTVSVVFPLESGEAKRLIEMGEGAWGSLWFSSREDALVWCDKFRAAVEGYEPVFE